MGPMQQQRMLRHWTFMHQGVPAEYRGQTSIIAPTEAPVQEGGRLYAENCASCPGSTGLGDGEAGRALNPSPALLAYMINMPMAVDEYLLWTISEGGKPLGTDMPAFKDSLTKEEIWKVIAFMRTGFPSGTGQN
jgi:mono/diheme cytochrome c family protein